ncbi:ABC transporter permease subunit [Dactylosporangium sp. AC04546]|uniref:ABC transporter permease n=1 Tax=Dactylosporangium sp. AC04546 TaxID=2862460 RepID=UPI001EDDBF1E|nr:ABC transporter permease subunit [Dactylosporangium sp. AC04546]WVK85826.1 ABC transporter permease subunit [Dactylosporangium sp. AC04546]
MNPTIARITTRGLLGRRRIWLLVPLPLILVGLALLGRAFGATPEEWGEPVIVGLGFAAVLPVIALIVGTGVVGSEIDDGTITHILAKPLPRSEILFTKLAVAVGVTAAFAGVPLFIAGVIANSLSLAFALVVGSVVGSLAYSALFVMVSVMTRRPVLLGLVYVVLWEGLLGNILSGTQKLSIQQYVLSIVDWLAPTDILHGKVSVPVSFVMAGVFTVAASAYAVQRLRTFSVAGETG